ncbi:MAG: cytochrome-c peroxidase [Planctomycetes bacterium]|nr:cytochrome-c peroxidase [Planctomycetota bacterium]
MKRRASFVACLALLCALPAIVAAAQDPAAAAPEFDAKTLTRIRQHSPRPPPPADPTNRVADDPRAAAFGQRLFFETRWSKNGEISCATCHEPERAFTDGKQLGEGLGKLERHTPSVLDVAYNRWFFWDGRADTLWAQAPGPLENDAEMGATRVGAAALVAEDAALRAAYTELFGAPPDVADRTRFPRDAKPSATNASANAAWLGMREEDRDAIDVVLANLAKSFAAYQRKLVTGPAPFDRFVEGLVDGDTTKLAALSPSAQRGLALFVGKANCRLCHSGPNFSDGEFHALGLVPLAGPPPRDSGRHAGAKLVKEHPFNAASRFSDARDGDAALRLSTVRSAPEMWGEFKTPSLRNVARTAPYMHEGQFTTLEQVVRFYSTMEGALPVGHHQETILQPLGLTDVEIADLVEFLRTLDGTDPPEELRRPPGAR